LKRLAEMLEALLPAGPLTLPMEETSASFGFPSKGLLLQDEHNLSANEQVY
jgi:hypothetical protein